MSDKTRYEKTDAGPRIPALAAGALVLLTLFAGGAAYLVLRFLSSSHTVSPSAVSSQATNLPPEPRLEADPMEGLRLLRKQEDQILTGYGWVDRTQGLVRIPIERAIDLTAQRGLPSREPKK